MTRRLLNIATVLSLLLCVAEAGLWVRSYWRYDGVGYYGRPSPAAKCYWVSSFRGKLTFCFFDRGGEITDVPGWSASTGPAARVSYVELELTPPERLLRYYRSPFSARRFYLYVHDSVLVTATAILPMIFALGLARTRRQVRRRARGLCRGCGYDLTGNVSGVCPECGTAATTT